MQICQMNTDTFMRKDDGKLYLNGKEIVKHRVEVGFKSWQIAGIFTVVGFMVGYFI